MNLNQTVTKYEATDEESVVEFIKQIAKVETVDKEIIKNSILIKQEANLTGMVAFEKHDQHAIIRYFIYDQYIMPDLLVNMFFKLYANAKEQGVNQLVAVASNSYAYQLFELLGFIEIRKSIDPKIFQYIEADDVNVMSIRL